MKYLIKIVSITIAFLIINTQGAFADILWVNDISITSPTTLEVEFSENPNLRVWEIEGEVKVLQDISLRWSMLQESNTVEVFLEDPLVENTHYSLLTIIGGDGSIDFKSPSSLNGSVIENDASVSDEDIQSIEIVNGNNILVTYKQDLEESEFEFKLLAENNIEKIENLDYFDSKITITVAPPFLSEKDYILMFIDLQDVDENYLDFDTGIYDFTSPKLSGLDSTEILLEQESQQQGEISWPETLEEKSSGENEEDSLEVIQIDRNNINEIPEIWENDESNIENLNAAGEEVSLEKGINEVAASVVETPDTGAETWVLVVLSLLINTIYYLSRRKRISLA